MINKALKYLAALFICSFHIIPFYLVLNVSLEPLAIPLQVGSS
jgi:hypothetical protein